MADNTKGDLVASELYLDLGKDLLGLCDKHIKKVENYGRRDKKVDDQVVAVTIASVVGMVQASAEWLYNLAALSRMEESGSLDKLANLLKQAQSGETSILEA